MALYPNRLALTPPFNENDEVTKELLRRLAIGQPTPALPRRFIQPDQPQPLPTPAAVSTTDAGNPPVRMLPAEPTKGFASNLGAPPAMDYSDLAVQRMEQVAKNAPVPVAKDDGSIGYVERVPELPPPVRIPELTAASLADSVVQVPEVAAALKRPTTIEPGAETIERQPNESEADYAARKHRAYEQSLRTESPYSKVKETPTGVQVDAPQKPHGAKARAMAGLLMALASLGQGVQAGGTEGALGAAITGGLIGAIDPGLAQRIGRQRQIATADVRTRQLDEQQAREAATAERQARTADLATLPQRRKDEERDKRITQRERNWERLVATTGFDPAHNPEHRRIQMEAAADGQILPATPAKPRPSRETEKQLVTNKDGSQTLYEREPGELNWHKSQGIPDSAPKPNEAQDNRIAENDAKRKQFEADERQYRSQAEEYNRQSSQLEAQAVALDKKNAALSSKPESFLSATEKAQLARAKELHTQAEKAAEKATEFWNKRAEADNQAQNVPQLKARAQMRGTGKTYSVEEVAAWAKARGLTNRQARKKLEAEGAKIQ